MSIDFSERSHAQFRRDISSATVGANFEPVSERLLPRQYIAAHVAAGGVDPACKTTMDVLTEAGLVDEKIGARGSVPAHIAFAHSRRKAFKAVVAPDRP